MTRPKLKIHPVAAMVPKMSAEAFAALKEDIEKHGLIEPIWVKGNEIIDGRHRYRACHELGRQCETREYQGTDIESFVISSNVARRQLSRQQKQWFIKRLLELHPEQSNRVIAAKLGVDDKTIGAARAAAERVAEIPQLNALRGADGKSYKARRAPSTPAPTHPATSLVNATDLEAKRFIKWLHDLHPNELTDAARFIEQLEVELRRLRAFPDHSAVNH